MACALNHFAPRSHTRPTGLRSRLAATPMIAAERSRQERRLLVRPRLVSIDVQDFRRELPLLEAAARQGMLRRRDEILIFGFRNFVLPAYFLSKNIPTGSGCSPKPAPTRSPTTGVIMELSPAGTGAATVVDVQTSGVSWSAIAAGAVAAAALTLALVAFGAGIGLSAISPWAGRVCQPPPSSSAPGSTSSSLP